MQSCETCQVQLLEYLYDLLDGADRQALEAHVAACPACQAALAKTRLQQQLLAAAAKMEFPTVAFHPPADAVTASVPATLPLAKRPQPAVARKPIHWGRWAVAAAVLLAVAGAGTLAAGIGVHVKRDRDTVQQYETARAQATQHQHDLDLQVRRTNEEREAKVHDIYDAVIKRELIVGVQGPGSVQPGAPTEYQISTTDLANKPVSAQVSVQVADNNGAKISEPIAAKRIADGTYRVTLPPDLSLRPQSHPILLVSAKRDTGSKTELQERLDLASKVYLTHLTTDKPMYQPGENVYFRSLTLERATLKPCDADLRLDYTITTPLGGVIQIAQGGNGLVKEGAGNMLLQFPDGKPIKGIGAGAYHLDENLPGGEYILTVRDQLNRFPEQQRKFIVNKYQKPRLNKQLDFNRKTYGAGDEVQAAVKVTSNDDTPLKGKMLNAVVTVDGKQYDAAGKVSNKVLSFKLEADGKTGKATVRFKLPTAIEKGEANLNLTFQDGANVEPLSRSIPIVLKKLNVEFYPEGGDLVAGLPNRVYFSVRTMLGKPADLKGQLLENGKPLAVAVATLSDDKEPGVNQGMGRFEFTPKAGAKYELKIDTPVGITSQHVLPAAKEDGVVLRVAEGVVGSNGQIKVSVSSTKERTLLIGAYCRGRLLDSVKLDKVDPKKGAAEATLKVEADFGGVCRITVFDEKTIPGLARRELKPVAERLVYKQPKEQLLVNVRSDKDAYVPGQRVKLTIKSVNENEEAAPAIVMLAVVDKSVVTMADEKTARSMPTHFLLTTEVQRPEDLEYADFLLGPQAKAKQALDLLLGTQGWRRFAEQDPTKFRKEHKDDAERLLVMTGQSAPRVTTFTKEKVDKVDVEYDARVAELQKEEQKAGTEANAAASAAPYLVAKAKLNVWKDRWDRFTFYGTPAVGLLLLLLAAVCLGLGLLREVAQARRYYLAALGSMALMLVVFGYWGVSFTTKRPNERQMAMLAQDQAPMAQANAPLFDGEGRNAKGARMEAEKPMLVRALGAGGGQGTGLPGDDKAKKEAKRFNAEGLEAKLDEKPKADLGVGGRGGIELNRARHARGAFGGGGGAAKKAGADGKFRQLAQEQFGKVPPMPMLPPRPGQPFRGGRPMPGPGGFGPATYFDQRHMQLASLPPLIVREYSHERSVGMTPEMRSDWAETLCWQPVLVLPDGKAEVSFDLCDSTTTFQVTAFAHSLDGRLGATTYNFDSRLPFTLQPKLPIEVTASDKIDVPLSLTNNTGAKRKVSVNVKELDGLALIKGEKNDEFEMKAGVPVRKVYRFQPIIEDGNATLTFEGKTAPFAADTVRNTFRVVPEGFPFVGSHSDVLEGSSLTTVTLPQTWVKGSLKCRVNVYPSTLADLQKGLEGLLREPNGCFEQTSTTNYPNVLILGYLKDSNQSKPEVEKHARDLIARGYQRLTSFECTNTSKQKKEGYEWFGGTAPAHEALTAYGLLQFRDMAKVSDVDPRMIERTRQYLMEQRDGNGGFKRNPRAIDTFGRAPQNITNAYIVWSLTEGSADDDVTKELDELLKQAKTSKDPYFLALVANSLVNRSRQAEATELLKAIAGLQKDDGHLDAEKTSITGSGGRDLQIETTALAMLAWLKANNPTFTPNVVKAVKWIGQQRGGYGGFGSTQSTILALKALIAYTKANKKTPESGELTVYVDDKPAGKLAFPAGASEALTLSVDNVEEILHPGANKVRVEMTGKNVFPYTLTWTYNTLMPVNPKEKDLLVKLATSLSKTNVSEGDGVQLRVKLENVSGKGQGMAVAVIGLPGGLTIPEDLKQLKDYTRLPLDGSRPRVSAFEIRGRELVLYWRDLAPGQKIDVPVDLTCRVPGEYSGPASRAYLYYNADFKYWVEPLKVNIAAK